VKSDQGPTTTFATTAVMKLHNTATIDPAVLVTSNGNMGMTEELAGTSHGSRVNGAFGIAHALPSVGAIIVGALLVARMNMRW